MKKRTILLIINLLICFFAFSQSTYKIGKTEYYTDKYYSTTGKPMVKRSQANKRTFLNTRGYSEIPNGYEIDHIIPLSQGGSDAPYNMQLLSVKQHKIKTARERGYRSNSSYPSVLKTYKSSSSYKSPRSYYTTASYPPASTYVPAPPSYRPVYSSPSYSTSGRASGKTIHTGSRGGKYYINSNGNKTYVKKN